MSLTFEQKKKKVGKADKARRQKKVRYNKRNDFKWPGVFLSQPEIQRRHNLYEKYRHSKQES